MFDIYCNFCLEQGAYVPATMELRVQRQDGSATQYIRCCERHQKQAVVTARTYAAQHVSCHHIQQSAAWGGGDSPLHIAVRGR